MNNERDFSYHHTKIFKIALNHFLDIRDDRDIADPPDLMDPWDDNTSTELGALLGRSILFYFKN